MSQYIPPTQPMTDSIENCTPPEDFENAWGRFYPMNIKDSKYINLCLDEFTVGRSPSCDFVLTCKEIEKRFFDCISKVHFKMRREEPNPGVFVTVLEDLSSNGTFVNGKLIGRNQFVVLTNHDNISVASPTYTIFVYQDLNISAYSEYPSEISDHYAIFNLLGKGGYGEVRLVFKKDTTQCFAMKMIDIEPIEKKKAIDAFSEVKILRSLNNDNIVKMSNVNLVGNSLYLFLEYCSGGDLGRYVIKKHHLEEDVCRFIFHQILCGVKYLHDNKVIHRDLKPANILLNDDSDRPKVKITDFGLSKFLDAPANVRTRCGTLSYAPPELQFSGISTKYDFRADVWSLGVILYYCLSGILPFRRDRPNLPIDYQIKNAKYSFDGPVWRKPELGRPMAVINKCIQVHPHQRCFVHELLGDDWFKRNDELARKRNLNVLNKENSVSVEQYANKKRRN